jgi:sugar/nucleoside kinase (ribokinase family)
MRKGIIVGGNWIIDQVKVIDKYPSQEALANIREEYTSNGGSAYNILKDLTKLKVAFPLEGIGLVGNDFQGQSILDDCQQHAIDASRIRKAANVSTSYTDVMSVRSTGKRTFFHQRGANALLDEPDFDLESSNSRIFHLGYILLLDKLDEVHENGRTGAANVLKKAGELGFITSADLVSEDSDRFRLIVPPALPYIDYLFVNEFEAQMLTGIQTSEDEQVSWDACYQAAVAILDRGVREWVIVHFPHGIVAVNKHRQPIFQAGIDLPGDKIIGAVGAGDAFAAGVLTGVHEGWEMAASLQLGVCAAATSLFAATSSDGILPQDECLTLSERYGYRSVPVLNNE